KEGSRAPAVGTTRSSSNSSRGCSRARPVRVLCPLRPAWRAVWFSDLSHFAHNVEIMMQLSVYRRRSVRPVIVSAFAERAEQRASEEQSSDQNLWGHLFTTPETLPRRRLARRGGPTASRRGRGASGSAERRSSGSGRSVEQERLSGRGEGDQGIPSRDR